MDSPISVSSIKITFYVNGKGECKGFHLAREECIDIRYLICPITQVVQSRRRLNRDTLLFAALTGWIYIVFSLGASGLSTQPILKRHNFACSPEIRRVQEGSSGSGGVIYFLTQTWNS